jgi:hypothetical protein
LRTDLLNGDCKLFAKIIVAKLQITAEIILLEEQSGLRKGRSCTDNVHIIQHLMEKHREFNQELHMLFINYAKTFNSVNRQML